jgi:cytochrome P450
MTEVIEVTGDDAAVPVLANAQLAMEAMSDLAAPQPRYLELIESGGFVEPMEGLVISFSRANTDYILRHHEEFSSRMDLGIGNVRPLIPLNVDPPDHSKYRKLLDPLFAPRRMDEQEEDITRRVNALIDTFVDTGECNFSEEFAELFPTSVFLGLLGLPEDELPMFLRLRDGVLHSEKMDPDALFDFEKRKAVQAKTGQEIYDYFGGLIELRKREPADDIITRFLSVEIDGERLSDDDILDICFLFLIAGLDTVTDSLTCFFAFLAQHPEHRDRKSVV